MELNTFTYLLNTGFTTIEIGLFYSWKRKYADSWLFWHKVAIFGRYLIGDDNVWQNWLSSSNVLIKILNLLPKELANKF